MGFHHRDAENNAGNAGNVSSSKDVSGISTDRNEVGHTEDGHTEDDETRNQSTTSDRALKGSVPGDHGVPGVHGVVLCLCGESFSLNSRVLASPREISLKA